MYHLAKYRFVSSMISPIKSSLAESIICKKHVLVEHIPGLERSLFQWSISCHRHDISYIASTRWMQWNQHAYSDSPLVSLSALHWKACFLCSTMSQLYTVVAKHLRTVTYRRRDSFRLPLSEASIHGHLVPLPEAGGDTDTSQRGSVAEGSCACRGCQEAESQGGMGQRPNRVAKVMPLWTIPFYKALHHLPLIPPMMISLMDSFTDEVRGFTAQLSSKPSFPEHVSLWRDILD